MNHLAVLKALEQMTERDDLDESTQNALQAFLAEFNAFIEDSEHDEAPISPDTVIDNGRPSNVVGDAETVLSPDIRPATRPETPALAHIFRRLRTPDRPAQRIATEPEGPMLGRFPNLGVVGRGGMGEVFRVRDPDLNRRMVIKVLRGDRVDDEEAVARFIEEAQLTSQLPHPGIVPVHELGVLDDNRLYFTMREVRGRTLTEVIEEAHREFAEADPQARQWEHGFRGLVDIFLRVCEPIAYAHSRNIIHRDLKPSNIMVGDFGEVQILDWGLAKVVGHAEAPGLGAEESEVMTHRNENSVFDTHEGRIVGTPAFMPPEQARGKLDSMGPASDVYSLGAILFLVIDGELPFQGNSTPAVIFKVLEGLTREPGSELGAPSELVDLCLRAMDPDPANRPADAKEFAAAVAAWRDGSNRREQALAHIEEADKLIPDIERLRLRADGLRSKSRQLLDDIKSTAPIEEKRAAWDLQDEADYLDREAGARRARSIQHLDTALTFSPDLHEAHDRLAAVYQREHAEAERRRDVADASELEVFIRAHNTGRFDRYLEGNGHLNLYTSPGGARVEIYRYVQKDRRLVAGLRRFFGLAPVADAEISMGSHLVELRARGCQTVRYPVFIARGETWTGSPPASDRPFDIALPQLGELEEDDIYVPGSYFWRGGDERATNGFPRSVPWVDPFVIKRDPVTKGQSLEFLNSFVEEGKEAEALRYCPRHTGNIGLGRNTPLFVRDERGRYQAQDDDPQSHNFPIHLVDWHSARAYAAWYSRRTRQKWRLPTEGEWEKAARGVDGRFYPWGDFLDPTWCRMLHSAHEVPRPQPVDANPDDISPYGMRGAGGNMRDWCLPNDPTEMEDPDFLAPFRGGCWFSTADMCRLASRELKPPTTCSSGTGFRLARSYSP